MNSSGPIYLGGTIPGQSISLEIGGNGGTPINLNQPIVRDLAQKLQPESQIVAPTDFYGKSQVRTVTYTSGSGNFIVPGYVNSITVSYPTSTGTVYNTYSVIPNQQIAYYIGQSVYDPYYGIWDLVTTFNGVNYPSYRKQVATFAGNVDQNIGLYSTWGVATTNGNSYSGAGYQSDLYNGAQAAGCFYQETGEGAHGDLYATITMNTMTTALFDGNTLANAYLVNVSGRGTVSLTTQPTVANSYRATVAIGDPQPSEGYYTYELWMQQATPITITW